MTHHLLNEARFPSLRQAVAGVLLAGFALPSWAQYDGLVWRCVQQRDPAYSVACMAIIGPGALPLLTAAPVAAAQRIGGRDLRPVAARGIDELLSDRPWTVPLFAPPTDRTSLTELLTMALCGDIPCQIEYRDFAVLAGR